MKKNFSIGVLMVVMVLGPLGHGALEATMRKQRTVPYLKSREEQQPLSPPPRDYYKPLPALCKITPRPHC